MIGSQKSGQEVRRDVSDARRAQNRAARDVVESGCSARSTAQPGHGLVPYPGLLHLAVAGARPGAARAAACSSIRRPLWTCSPGWRGCRAHNRPDATRLHETSRWRTRRSQPSSTPTARTATSMQAQPRFPTTICWRSAATAASSCFTEEPSRYSESDAYPLIYTAKTLRCGRSPKAEKSPSRFPQPMRLKGHSLITQQLRPVPYLYDEPLISPGEQGLNAVELINGLILSSKTARQ